MIIFYNNIPAYRAARQKEARWRMDAFKGAGHSIAGMPIRAMTVRDMILLSDMKCPILAGHDPKLGELVRFLWIMSPEFELWWDKAGWRRFAKRLQPVAAWLHARKCRRALDIGRLEKLRRLNLGNGWRFEVPSKSKLALAVEECRQYVNLMFLDSPPAPTEQGESFISGLAYWTGELLSEGILQNEDEVHRAPLPKVFQWLKYLRRKRDPKSAEFNVEAGELRRKIVAGLNARRFTQEDLQAGLVNLN